MCKYLLILGPFVTHFSFSQENFTIKDVDTPPLFSECDEKKDSKDCFIEQLNMEVSKKMNIMKLLNEKYKKAYAQFLISETGEIQDIRIRSKSEMIKAELFKALEVLQFKFPATIDDQPVAILYTLPFRFQKIERRSVPKTLGYPFQDAPIRN